MNLIKFNYHYHKKLHNLYIVTYTVYNDRFNILRNIVKKVLKDNGYYYFGTTLYIRYDFQNYNIDYRILSYLEREFLLKEIETELLKKNLNMYYINNIELDIIVH